MPSQMGDFHVNGRMMRYSLFAPRLYNLCVANGFEPGRIMPSRAFCSDENQGYPIILMAKHFGIFPFDHGRVGGIVSTFRHGPHAHHGKDLVIVQASHVGYDPETGRFGTYRRPRMDGEPHTTSCGKIGAVMEWYQGEYAFARDHIAFARMDGQAVVVIDNRLLDAGREEGLFLNLDRFIAATAEGQRPDPCRVFSTARAYPVHSDLAARLPESVFQSDRRKPMGDRLTADLFGFRRRIEEAVEGHDQLEHNLSQSMPHIVTSPHSALAAAQANTQIEFDRTYRSILLDPAYQGRNLAFVSGINIDISRHQGQLFPLTKFVPWAAYFQTRQGERRVLEQDDLLAALNAQSAENPDQIELDGAISEMEKMPEVMIEVDA
ncbi:MAG: hypothetical protein JEZ11_18250 [Desulfobacterales bacterium]|nr:hypothetical protein [Desulfobacterales bacterium]